MIISNPIPLSEMSQVLNPDLFYTTKKFKAEHKWTLQNGHKFHF